MKPEQYQRLLDRLFEVRNTDELFDLEVAFAPFDEEDGVAQRALFQLACRWCHLARGPAPAQESFELVRRPPDAAHHRFEVRGRIGQRIVRVGWADGALFGSLYALRRLEHAHDPARTAASAQAWIRASLDAVIEDVPTRAVA